MKVAQHVNSIKVISFDAEGTLVTPRFSEVIWHESIPSLFAQRWGLTLDRAKQEVRVAYDEVGEQRTDWYDIKYWFRRFDLGDHAALLRSCTQEIAYYDDVLQTLPRLGEKYDLIVISNSAREFLDELMKPLQEYFRNVFSTLSDFGAMKSPELYLKICGLMNIKPEEMVHVGDHREFDYDMSRRAGIKGLFLDRERTCSGEGVIGDLGQLIKVL